MQQIQIFFITRLYILGPPRELFCSPAAFVCSFLLTLRRIKITYTMNRLLALIIMIAAAMCGASAQNTASVLRAIENSKVHQLANGFRIQIVHTGEYKYCTCRLSADVSMLQEDPTPGIKQVVAAMTGSDLVAGEVIVKTMVSHEQALDSLLIFMSEVMYGNDSRYVNFKDYKERRIRSLRQNGESMSDMASRMIGLPTVTAEGLQQISRDAYDQYRKLCFSPERCLLTIVSNAREDEIIKAAEKFMGGATRQTLKTKTKPRSIMPCDVIQLIPDTTSTRYEAIAKHYYQCEKKPQNYILNKVVYYMMYGNYAGDASSLSCFSYDVNTLHTEKPNGEFGAMARALYDPRKPDYKNEPSLNEAKKKVIAGFKEKFQMPDYAAELASYLILYNFPGNYFTTFEQSVRSVTTAEARQFASGICQNGSSILLVRGNEKDLHCDIIEQAAYRDIIISSPGKETREVRIGKGFGAQSILERYLSVTGLSNPPKNLTATINTTYQYPNGNTYKATGRLMRKPPNLYRLENYILHEDSIPLFHYREMCDGASGSDSTKLYGLAIANPMRLQQLRQKAAFPQEASYEALGMKARLLCSYEDFKNGYVKVAVSEASDHNYHDYYSLSTGLRDRTDIMNPQGLRAKTILYEYAQTDKYMLVSKATEMAIDLITTVELGPYDLGTVLKKTDFQLSADGKKKK